MAGLTPIQKANALISLYVELYVQRYGTKPQNFNRHALRWGFDSMIEDLGYDRAQVVIKDYLEYSGKGEHNHTYLLYNYEKMDKHLRDIEEDDLRRAEIRENTRKLVEGIERN